MAFEFHNPQENAIDCTLPQPLGLIRVKPGDFVPTPEQERRGITAEVFTPFTEAKFSLKPAPPVARRRLLEAAGLEVPSDLVRRTRHLPEFGGGGGGNTVAPSSSPAQEAQGPSAQEREDALRLFQVSLSNRLPGVSGLAIDSRELAFLTERLFSWETESRVKPGVTTGETNIDEVVKAYNAEFAPAAPPQISEPEPAGEEVDEPEMTTEADVRAVMDQINAEKPKPVTPSGDMDELQRTVDKSCSSVGPLPPAQAPPTS